ncbi:uncharacterized protein CC84DRAFT_301429 [Paraphaeosphaeria sporulosa]|uniref:Uncharacterized protein n=1 Tax=Paraphaeosphaeria sporulosa TaxID=1460663 RepID=A0A177BXZ7_9PLEO|nr:uncharacterized protein CC84DRAFT_301429 [Paraphaeosphaeria sporulosa]OAG00394.1 hypothetical protein CC84DRAFT_301429 [Paraphaeosphaeria sporulosa]
MQVAIRRLCAAPHAAQSIMTEEGASSSHNERQTGTPRPLDVQRVGINAEAWQCLQIAEIEDPLLVEGGSARTSSTASCCPSHGVSGSRGWVRIRVANEVSVFRGDGCRSGKGSQTLTLPGPCSLNRFPEKDRLWRGARASGWCRRGRVKLA